MSEKTSNEVAVVGIICAVVVLALICGVIGGCMWGIPQYKVYKQTLRGEANLKEQEFAKQIAVEEAKAKLESAVLLADAEIERARGVAEANKIIGDSLSNGGDQYLQYLAIDAQKEMAASENHTTVYIPSGENGIPLVKTVE